MLLVLTWWKTINERLIVSLWLWTGKILTLHEILWMSKSYSATRIITKKATNIPKSIPTQISTLKSIFLIIKKVNLNRFWKSVKKKRSLLWQQNWSDRSFRHYYLTLTCSFNILPTLACKVTTFGSQSRIRQVPYVSEKVTVVIKSSLSSPLLITFWQNYFCTWSKYILFLKVSKTSHYGD